MASPPRTVKARLTFRRFGQERTLPFRPAPARPFQQPPPGPRSTATSTPRAASPAPSATGTVASLTTSSATSTSASASTSTWPPKPTSAPKPPPDPSSPHIVTSFITTHLGPADGGPATNTRTPSLQPTHVLLLHRSPHAPRLPGRWAACSGRIEATDVGPRAAALREVAEETGLRPPHVQWLLDGTPLEVEDGGRAWHVHPFVWAVRAADRARVRLDEWHTASAWVDVREVRGWETVWGLGESLEACLRELEVARLEGELPAEEDLWWKLDGA